MSIFRSLSAVWLIACCTSHLMADDPSVQQWHKLTLSFNGPRTYETAETNPFTDYRLLVTFRHGQQTRVIRGFYAADGNAAETGSATGRVWQVRFSPDLTGDWSWEASLKKGPDIAISDDPEAGTLVPLQVSTGKFHVRENSVSENAADFRTRGFLVAVDGYFQFQGTQQRWLKAGADSPENLLAFVDFDGTYRMSTEISEGEAQPAKELHRYAAHLKDWNNGDPTWQDGKGKALIGALNYLADTGMNAVYFLTFNIQGDGKDVWPYASPDDFTRFDCSKLDQWEIVFDHMQRRGILMHVVTQETENERLLDGGDTARLRKLYYRELIARFAHHPALTWNLGEENGPAEFSPDGQTAEQQKAMASFLKTADPYRHPVVIHTHAAAGLKDELLPAILGHLPLDGLSFQVDHRETVYDQISKWRRRSEANGQRWLICMDEIGMWHTGAVPDEDDSDRNDLRRHVLWGSLLAGAAGVEWYFGAKYPHNDLTSEDWRQRATLWKQTALATRFFEREVPYWELAPCRNFTNVEGAYCSCLPGSFYIAYLPGLADDKPIQLNKNLAGFQIQWLAPKTSATPTDGSIRTVANDAPRQVGAPVSDEQNDWVLILRQP